MNGLGNRIIGRRTTTAGTILGLVVIVAEVWIITSWKLSQAPPAAVTVNEAGVRSDLLAIAHAERKYIASHGSYASIDKLQQDGSLPFSGLHRAGYFYTAEVDDGQHFRITGRPSEVAKASYPIYSIDETMQISVDAGIGLQ